MICRTCGNVLESWGLGPEWCPTCDKNMGQLTYFTDQEVQGLDQEFAAMLDVARGISGVPYHLTATIGGVHAPNSAHYKGLAADIGLGHLTEGFDRDTARYAIVNGLLAAGFKRIEICPLHIHVDWGQPPEYVSPILWLGEDT